MNGVSVVVCCHNSAPRLPQTLAHLAKQVVPSGIPWEIIVVDNASTDNTADLAVKEWKNYKLEDVLFRIVHQPKPGLTYAREIGTESSRFDVLIFCDDDNWLSPNYIRYGYELLSKRNDIGAIGGRGIAVSDSEFPNWFDRYKGYYACVEQGNAEGDITFIRGYLFGAGLIIRKEAMESIKIFRDTVILTDRTGSSLSSGGDVEISYQLRLMNWKLWYSPLLSFYHQIPQQRLNEDYLFKLVMGITKSGVYLNPYLYLLNGKKLNFTNYLKDLTHYAIRFVNYLMKRLFGSSLDVRLSVVASGYSFLSLCSDFQNQFKNYSALRRRIGIR